MSRMSEFVSLYGESLVKKPDLALLSILAVTFNIPIIRDIKLKDGNNLRVMLAGRTELDLALGKEYELETTAFIRSHLSQGDIFFDVGANIGFFSRLGAEMVGKSGVVASFEPSPTTTNILLENIQAYPQVKVEQVAVGSVNLDQVEMSEFGVRHQLATLGARPRSEAHRIPKAKKTFVQMISLDEYYDRTRLYPTLVKMDVEGYEMDVLLGMERLMSKGKPVIVAEVGGDRYRNKGKTTADIMHFILDHGYQCFAQIGNTRLSAEEILQKADTTSFNLFAVPSY